MNTNGNELFERAIKDDYLSESLAYFKDNKSLDSYLELCKILNYRKFYLALNLSFKNKKMMKKFNKEGYVPLEKMDELFYKDVLKAEISSNAGSELVLCAYSDPSKIDFSSGLVNGLEETTLEVAYEKYIKNCMIGGIIFNSMEEEFLIPLPYIEYVINGDYEAIKNRMTRKN